MAQTNQKSIGRLIFSLLASLITGACVFAGMLLLFFAIGLFGWSDGGNAKEISRLERSNDIILFISTIVALAASIFMMIRLNRPFNDITNNP